MSRVRPTGRTASLVAIAVALVAVIALVAPRSALAQRPAPAPTIESVAAFDPPAASIGDRVTLTLRVTHPDDVIVKASAPNIENVDVVNTVPSTTAPATPAATTPGGPGTPAGSAQVTTFVYTLQPFLLGTLDIGTVRLSWLRADGSTGAVNVPGAKLIVAPVRAPNDQALRPLKPQASIAGAPPAWIRPAIAISAFLALVLVAALIALIVERRRARIPVAATPLDVSPERIARDALDALGVQAPPARLDYQAYYGGLAVTVRTYLAARFGFNAHALTTRELKRRMVSHGVDRWQARLVGGLLERCDDAVYARRYPDPASADHDLTVAYEIVELSRPRAAAPGPAQGEAAPA